MSVVVSRGEPHRDGEAGQSRSSSIRRAEASLPAFFQELRPDWHSQWAWDHYEGTVLALARRFGLTELCEIGGGRDPLFLPENPAMRGLDLTVNDIDQLELDFAPPGLRKARFDIAGDLSEPDARAGAYDLMFSRMVFEHVDGVEQAWTNIHRLLKPGGVALAFFPTLWAPVFALNHMIPESLSRRIVHALFPARRDGGSDPKFPALYDQCWGDEDKMRPMLRRAGFSDMHVQPFWGHGYFERLPGLREADKLFNALSARIGWRFVTTYAYVVVRKAG
jgi:SAM-dependent methyltransferase